MITHDLVVRGGTVHNGTGAEPFVADIAIRDGRIVEIGQVAGQGREEIDAAGMIVTPGFVDIHTHYDGQITWENTLAPSSNHGVTTVIMGNCGVGFAPVRPGDHELMIKLMEGVEDIPDVVMAEGVPFNWETFPQYLDAIEQRHSDIDFAAQLPHSPLRVYVMGERGANLEPPTDHDLAEMRRLTTEAIEAGALGVSTSRAYVHRFRDGRLAPSVPTENIEVLALAEGLRDAGTGVFEMLPNYDIPAGERFDLIEAVARTSGRPVSFTYMTQASKPEDWQETAARLAQAREDGLEIRGQILARPTAGMMGLELSLHPFALNPSFRPLQDLPLAEKVARMRDPDLRQRILSEQPEDPHPLFVYMISDFDRMFVLGDPPNYHPRAEDSIGAQASRRGIDPRALAYDALLELDGKQLFYRPMGNDGGDRFHDAGRNLLGNERTIPALGDGGAHYSMICDAAYPTYLLLHWVRDAEPDYRLPLPFAIRKLTMEPAQAVGLNDRGVLREGAKADLNVIDLARLHLHAPEPTYDLPTGGRRLSQRSQGYEATVVSGVITYRNGQSTGALPGRLVRGAKAAAEPVAA